MITQELIETLSVSEWEELKRFLQFRYPRMREDVLRSLNVLQQFGGSDFSRKDLHDRLYPNTAFNDKHIRYLLTDVNKLISDFFSYKQLCKQARQQQLLLLQELADRGCQRTFDKTFHRELKDLSDTGIIDTQTLYHYYELHSLKAQVELSTGKRSSEAFEDSSAYLDQYFVAKKLQVSAEKININFILKKEWNDPFLETILKHIDSGLFSQSPYIGVYRLIIQSMTEPEDQQVFVTLKEELNRMVGRLSAPELTDLYQYLLNYCIRSINAGKLEFENELLAVYKGALLNGALLNNNVISQWDFKNVVTIALRTGNLDYARQFIHGYKHFLPTDQRTNALAYNLANLHFYEKNFRAAISQLQKVDMDDVFYRLDARSILLKSYYELDDTDALFYHATAFRSLLNRNRKISDHQRRLYLNLIKYTLSLARSANEPTKVRKIRQRLLQDRSVADLKWLETKINDL